MFIGASIHDVAQVVGAGYAISTEAGDTGTVVKLMRVAMLAPVIVAVGLYRAQQEQPRGQAADPAAVSSPASSRWWSPTACYRCPIVRESGSTLSRWCLVAAIAALGMKTRLGDIVEIGWKPVLLMIVETLVIAAIPLTAIALGWV